MKFRYNRKDELEVVGFGVFKPGAIVTIEDESEIKRYLDSGYFDEVKIKEKKEKIKKKKKNNKQKSKKKGVDKKWHRVQEDI